MKSSENVIKTKNLLESLNRKGKQDRDKLASDLKTSVQRISGFIDSVEELNFVSVDREVRPYQVEIGELGKEVLALLDRNAPRDIIRKGVDNIRK
jgi:hypothetical protein